MKRGIVWTAQLEKARNTQSVSGTIIQSDQNKPAKLEPQCEAILTVVAIRFFKTTSAVLNNEFYIFVKQIRSDFMILDISDSEFRKFLGDPKLSLPLKWNGCDFLFTLNELFDYYIEKLESCKSNSGSASGNSKAFSAPPITHVNTEKVQKACNALVRAVEHYLNGFPSRAYSSFKKSMNHIFMTQPLRMYRDNASEQFKDKNNQPNLFRITSISDNGPHKRGHVFHTPYDLRSKVSASRYSIAGHPSLYLGTSLNLCYEETRPNPRQGHTLASIFRLERMRENTEIQIIELGVKPQDFVERPNKEYQGGIDDSLLEKPGVRAAYLLWYPLIAACSYIRKHRDDPFAPEYIIPQLLMQWVRANFSDRPENALNGIRYFSCASPKASNMGFNYVFPTNGKPLTYPRSLPYCQVLANSFQLSEPVNFNQFTNPSDCEQYLKTYSHFDFVWN